MPLTLPDIELLPDGSVSFPRQGEEPPAGSVYMFQYGDSSTVKIGSTRNAVNKRRTALQVGCPETLQVFLVWATSAPKRLEKHIKAHFAAYRIRGEWYALPDQVVAVLHGRGA
jgi:Meiotically up-regulated gene 113